METRNALFLYAAALFTITFLWFHFPIRYFTVTIEANVNCVRYLHVYFENTAPYAEGRVYGPNNVLPVSWLSTTRADFSRPLNITASYWLFFGQTPVTRLMVESTCNFGMGPKSVNNCEVAKEVSMGVSCPKQRTATSANYVTYIVFAKEDSKRCY
uniref:Uncharacterized protein n=1 Tax=Ditylenchus dipsaci TaxID=166011 RepID=A0A915DGB2_9BILA